MMWQGLETFYNVGRPTLSMTFYLDESGHSGDIVNSGDGFDFKGQPYFVLAAVGVSDESAVVTRIEELRALHRISPGELKSKSLMAKPKFVLEVIDYLESIGAPLFVELVDKRYFICVHITSFQLLPSCMGFPEGAPMTFLRNTVADFLNAEAPDQVLDAFVQACLEPSEAHLLQSLSLLQDLGVRLLDIPGKKDIARGVVMMVEDARNEYLELKEQDPDAFLQFLPPPDHNKRSKRVWMLPNLTSFANIYARLNLYFRRNLQGVHIVHDQQLELEDILHLGKATVEAQKDQSQVPYTPHSDFIFEEMATFTFAQSHEGIGLQIADVVAGAVMRYFRDSPSATVNPDLAKAVERLISTSDARTGYGVNQVVASQDVRYA